MLDGSLLQVNVSETSNLVRVSSLDQVLQTRRMVKKTTIVTIVLWVWNIEKWCSVHLWILNMPYFGVRIVDIKLFRGEDSYGFWQQYSIHSQLSTLCHQNVSPSYANLLSTWFQATKRAIYSHLETIQAEEQIVKMSAVAKCVSALNKAKSLATCTSRDKLGMFFELVQPKLRYLDMIIPIYVDQDHEIMIGADVSIGIVVQGFRRIANITMTLVRK